MSDVFISYAHEDRPVAKTFADLLTHQGHSVFWDRQIVPGTTWDETIERELKQARCVVVLWSKHSVSSKWVKTEAGEAAERSVLLPVLIEETELPLRFKSLQTASLINWDENEEDPELQSLIQAVKRLTDLNASGGTAQPSLPTPARRSWTRRRRRWLIGLLIALTIMGLGLYKTHQIAIRKGWFTTKLTFYTLLESAEGLAVGDAVTVAGSPVGEIVRIELMPPHDFYDVCVIFTIREPYYGFVWTGSRAVVQWSPSRLKRSVNIPKATEGIPCYLFRDVVELPLKDALPALEHGEVTPAQDVYDGVLGTNLIVKAFQKVSAKDAEKLVQLGVDRLQVFYPNKITKAPTAIWDHQSGKYLAMNQQRWGFWLPADEATNPKP